MWPGNPLTAADLFSSGNPVMPTKVGSRSRWLVSAEQLVPGLASGCAMMSGTWALAS